MYYDFGMTQLKKINTQHKTNKQKQTQTNKQTNQTNTMQIGHDNWVRSVQFHPSGKYLISTSDDKSIKVWDLKQMKAIKTINDAHAHFVSCMDFHKNVMATGGVDDVLKIWACGDK